MIKRGLADRLDDAIDEFEQTWSGESSDVEAVLSRHGLGDDPVAVAEVIRVDIELRTDRGLSTEVGGYLERFPVLRSEPTTVADIAYEDYRCRSSNGLEVSPSRWRGLPGVGEQRWYRDLFDASSRRSLKPRSTPTAPEATEDPAFIAALEESGFSLVQLIGVGAFSQVFLATQSDLADRFVVLKVVNQPLSEPQHMALLQHTNIVPIYSFHQVFDRSVICMPYAGSVTLSDFLKSKSDVATRGGQSLVQTVQSRIDDTRREFEEQCNDEAPIPSLNTPAADDAAILTPLDAFSDYGCGDLALWIFQRLAGALAHAHARGVVHYDLKPSNVLIRNDGEPALLDFNLSHLNDGQIARHAGGTLPYMSPEAYRAMMGQSEPPRPASDIYGLGVLLFEFVTGRLPYAPPVSPAPIDLGTALDARRGTPDWRPEDNVSPGLRSIIDRCLQFSPRDRYESAEDLQSDLQREQQNLALVYTREPSRSRVQKWTRRHPKLISTGAVAAVLLAVLIPIARMAVNSKSKIKNLRADNTLLTFSDFSEESEEILSDLVANSDRQLEDKIRDATAVLEDYDLLSVDGIERVLSGLEPSKSKDARDQFRRHILQVAIFEASRLSQLRLSDPDASKDFSRLDQLMDAAKSIDGETDDRASLFVQAKRARLAGEIEKHQTLVDRAESIAPQSDSDRYLEAVRLIVESNFDEANALLTALADRGSVPPALRWMLVGETQFRKGLFDDAKISFTQAIERNPETAALYVMRGRCHYELREGDSAIRDYRKAIELEPDARVAWAQMGMLHHNRREYDKALDCYEQILKHYPERIWPHIQRAKIFRAQGKEDAAEVEFEIAMSTDSVDPWELVERAKALRERAPEAALKDLERASILKPDTPFYLQQRAEILAYPLGRHQEAIDLFTQVLEKQPSNESALINRGLSYVRLGNIQLGLKDAMAAMADENKPRNVYQAACLNALIDQEPRQRRAITLLATALRQGYNPDDLLGDPDLQSLHGREDFDAIVEVYEIGERFRRRYQTRTNN